MTARPPAVAPAAGGDCPLVSVVTVVLNGMPQIERAMDSVLAQTWPRIEYIVIDGGSTDGTLEVIEARAQRLATWISEPDRGISDAFNKGIARATGRFIQLVNADDWLEPEQIARAVRALEAAGAAFVFGDLVYHDHQGRPTHRVQGDPDYAARLATGMPDLNHPTLLARRAIYDRIGGFDPALRYAMDYDWLLRAHAGGFRGIHAPDVTGHMTAGGAADRGWRAALVEVMRVSRRHGCPASTALSLLLYRLVKGGSRRALLRLGASALHDRIRRRLNPRLRTAG